MILVISSIIGILVIGVAIYFFRRKKIAANDAGYVLKGDENAQQEYDLAHEDAVKLNKAEKEELSWQFLYELTDLILEKFSKADQDKLVEIGQKMQADGIQYEHVVSLGIRPEYIKKIEEEMKRSEEKEKSGDIGRQA